LGVGEKRVGRTNLNLNNMTEYDFLILSPSEKDIKIIKNSKGYLKSTI
jgi:hypothetical protein